MLQAAERLLTGQGVEELRVADLNRPRLPMGTRVILNTKRRGDLLYWWRKVLLLLFNTSVKT